MLDLLPGAHVIGGEPFCVRIPPDGSLHPISDEEAGLTKRPTMKESMQARIEDGLGKFEP